MTDFAHEQKVLIALAKEHAEARRPVRTLIVLAACNAKTGAQQDGVITALVALKRQSLVVQHDDSWSVTADGRKAEQHLATRSVPPKPPIVPSPLESGFKQPSKVRDTIRPMVGGAPRPVTRPTEQEVSRKTPAAAVTEQPAAQPACHGCVAQVGEYHAPECPAVNAFTAGRIQPAVNHAGATSLDPALIERCAVMNRILLAQAYAFLEAGEPEAKRDLAWLVETGEQLLAAGGME